MKSERQIKDKIKQLKEQLDICSMHPEVTFQNFSRRFDLQKEIDILEWILKSNSKESRK